MSWGRSEVTTILEGMTLFITRASRGMGSAIAQCAALDAANIVVVAKRAATHFSRARSHNAVEEINTTAGAGRSARAKFAWRNRVALAGWASLPDC
jgi:NAD(P)-dependent dehydrogenase (short-subunit alcohol dehydrogenase family)